MISKRQIGIQDDTEVLLRCCLSYSAIVENKRGVFYLICLSATNYFLNLLTRVRMKSDVLLLSWHLPAQN